MEHHALYVILEIIAQVAQLASKLVQLEHTHLMAQRIFI